MIAVDVRTTGEQIDVVNERKLFDCRRTTLGRTATSTRWYLHPRSPTSDTPRFERSESTPLAPGTFDRLPRTCSARTRRGGQDDGEGLAVD